MLVVDAERRKFTNEINKRKREQNNIKKANERERMVRGKYVTRDKGGE